MKNSFRIETGSMSSDHKKLSRLAPSEAHLPAARMGQDTCTVRKTSRNAAQSRIKGVIKRYKERHCLSCNDYWRDIIPYNDC